MPQLMPLNWMFSSLMVFMMVVMACAVYSNKLLFSKVGDSNQNMSLSLGLWCW